MYELKTKVNDNVLILAPIGRIDSSNAAQADADIEAARKNPHNKVIMDIAELEYISSAGLRVILRLRKSEPSLELINAISEVYEVFEMTGFSEMIPIKKAFRELSVDGCEVIGQGANGKVYRLDPDTIIKVYLNPDSLPDIERERELARRAFVLGIPTAIPYDVVKVGEGYGSVFELLNAKSFAKLLKEDASNEDMVIEQSVELLKKIHSTEVKPGDMPDMREVVIGWAKFLKDYLPAETAEKLVKLVSDVPTDYHMMHGDYHIKNIMLQNGEVLLIDMDTLCHGNPVFELGSMFNAYVGFSEADHDVAMSFLGIPYDMAVRIWKKSLPLYLGTNDEAKLTDVENKAMLIGYTRLMRRLIRRGGLDNPESKAVVELYKGHIIDLVSKVDTLLF